MPPRGSDFFVPGLDEESRPPSGRCGSRARSAARTLSTLKMPRWAGAIAEEGMPLRTGHAGVPAEPGRNVAALREAVAGRRAPRIGGASIQGHLVRRHGPGVCEKRGPEVRLIEVRKQLVHPALSHGEVARMGAASGGEASLHVVMVMQCDADLHEIVLALRPGGGGADVLHGGDQEGEEDREEGDHDQQFNEREGPRFGVGSADRRSARSRDCSQ